MPDDFLLGATKARQAEHGMQHGEGVGGDVGPAFAYGSNIGSGHAASVWEPGTRRDRSIRDSRPRLSVPAQFGRKLTPSLLNESRYPPAKRNASATLKAGILRRAAASSAWRSSAGEHP